MIFNFFLNGHYLFGGRCICRQGHVNRERIKLMCLHSASSNFTDHIEHRCFLYYKHHSRTPPHANHFDSELMKNISFALFKYR